MLRPIKFRAWDGNEMSKPFTLLDICGDDLGNGMVRDVMSYPCLYLERIKDLMQFTGLTDKNGKEIYEGDIVREEYNWEGKSKVVEYNAAGFRIKLGEGTWQSMDQRMNYEVIGNVFENPELLKS